MELLMTILFYLGCVFVVFGLIFFLLSGIGIIRMPDTFTRIHAGTKATTLGAAMTFIGIGLIHPSWFFKLFLLALFFLLTNPISSSVLARSTYKSGYKYVNKSGIDMYKEVSEEQEKEVRPDSEQSNDTVQEEAD
jgi:multicomponent Na+:H+ antiporter subunit G